MRICPLVVPKIKPHTHTLFVHGSGFNILTIPDTHLLLQYRSAIVRVSSIRNGFIKLVHEDQSIFLTNTITCMCAKI